MMPSKRIDWMSRGVVCFINALTVTCTQVRFRRRRASSEGLSRLARSMSTTLRVICIATAFDEMGVSNCHV